MNCPRCKKQMKERRFFINNTLFSGLHLFELLLALLIIPVLMAGINRLVYSIGFDNFSSCFLLGEALV